MTFSPRLAVAIAALIAAAGLSGCATAVPGSPEEQLWFDKAVGYDVNHIPPDIRLRGGIGYPRTVP